MKKSTIGSNVWSSTPITSGLSICNQHTVQVVIVDNLSSSNSSYYVFTINCYSTPVIEIISPTNNEAINISTSINLNGTYSDPCCSNSTIQLNFSSGTWSDIKYVSNLTGTWSYLLSCTMSDFDINQNTIDVRIINVCGMEGTKSVLEKVISWEVTSTGSNCPSVRDRLTAIWTGDKMIVWGGYNGLYLNTGGIMSICE